MKTFHWIFCSLITLACVAQANLGGVYNGTGVRAYPNGGNVVCHTGFGITLDVKTLSIEGLIYYCGNKAFAYPHPFRFEIKGGELFVDSEKVGTFTQDSFNIRYRLKDVEYTFILAKDENDFLSFKHLETSKQLRVGFNSKVKPDSHRRLGGREFSLRQGSGILKPANWRELAPFVHFSPRRDELPAAFDWRTKGVVTSVKDQKRCDRGGWAFASAGALESIIQIAKGNTESLAPQQLLSCQPHYGNCNGGWVALGFYLLKGANTEADYPFASSGSPAACVTSVSAHEKISEWGYVGNEFLSPSREELKTALLRQGPLVVSVTANIGQFKAYRSGIFNDCVTTLHPDHFVLLVGWNDNEGYWIIKNSWGESWGEKGYMRIAYTSESGNSCNNLGDIAAFAKLPN